MPSIRIGPAASPAHGGQQWGAGVWGSGLNDPSNVPHFGKAWYPDQSTPLVVPGEIPRAIFRGADQAAPAAPIDVDLELLSIPIAQLALAPAASLAVPLLSLPVVALDPTLASRLDVGLQNVPVTPLAPSATSALTLPLQAVPLLTLAPALVTQLTLDLRVLPVVPLAPSASSALNLGLVTAPILPLAPTLAEQLVLPLVALPVVPLEVVPEVPNAAITIDLPLLEILIHTISPTIDQEQLPPISVGRATHFAPRPQPIVIELELLQVHLLALPPELRLWTTLDHAGAEIRIETIDPTIEWDWRPVAIAEDEEDLVGV